MFCGYLLITSKLIGGIMGRSMEHIIDYVMDDG